MMGYVAPFPRVSVINEAVVGYVPQRGQYLCSSTMDEDVKRLEREDVVKEDEKEPNNQERRR